MRRVELTVMKFVGQDKRSSVRSAVWRSRVSRVLPEPGGRTYPATRIFSPNRFLPPSLDRIRGWRAWLIGKWDGVPLVIGIRGWFTVNDKVV